MAKITIPMGLYLEASSVFHWATKRHFQLWFTGQEAKRHRRSESVLKRLVKNGKLRSVLYGSKLIYAVPRKVKNEFSELSKVVHGLACTECLVRTYRSRMDGVVVAEKYFRGFGCVPEWGIVYPNGTMLLLEFCTKSNFFYSGNMLGKISAYRSHLPRIEQQFDSKAVVLFVLDVSRDTVKKYVGPADGMSARSAALRYEGDSVPSDPFFFTDYETFLKVPFGRQLTEPIYFWSDGKTYPLTKNGY